MTKLPLNRDTFEAWLDRYGPAPARWPDRVAAEALLSRDDTARDLLARAQGFDRLLAQAAATTDRGPADGALVDRIMAAAERTPRLAVVRNDDVQLPQRRSDPTPTTRREWRLSHQVTSGLMAASLVLGIGLGSTALGPWAATLVPSFAQDEATTATEIVLAQAAAESDDDTGSLGL